MHKCSLLTCWQKDMLLKVVAINDTLIWCKIYLAVAKIIGLSTCVLVIWLTNLGFIHYSFLKFIKPALVEQCPFNQQMALMFELGTQHEWVKLVIENRWNLSQYYTNNNIYYTTIIWTDNLQLASEHNVVDSLV